MAAVSVRCLPYVFVVIAFIICVEIAVIKYPSGVQPP